MQPQPDYFALYSLTPTLSPDTTALRKKYYNLSLQHHPDRSGSAEGAEQVAALQLSSQINEGYRILGDEEALLGYVLRRAEMLEEGEQYKLQQDFLMEMMDLNEAVDIAVAEPDKYEEAQRALNAELAVWESGFAPLRDRFNFGEQASDLLAVLKDFYFRKKYLQRIKERLDLPR